MTTATFVICTMQMSVGICLQRLGVLLGAVPVGLGYLAIVAFPAGSTVAHTIQSFTIMLTTVFALFPARPGSAVQRDLTIYPSPPSLTTTAAHISIDWYYPGTNTPYPEARDWFLNNYLRNQ